MKFSVLLPTYNRLDLLKYAIESVQRQDYDNWEVVVSDNQSVDNVRGYIASLNDPRFNYSRTETFLNVTDNWNRALSRATGDYVIMLGDDDALMPGYFSKMMELIQQFEQPDLIYTEAYQYACPGVLPDAPEGHLLVGRNRFFDTTAPHMLTPETKRTLMTRLMNMELIINFNMQHSLLHRSLIEKLSRRGEYFRSLFPDFYATMAALLSTDRVLVYQQPMVIIGITPRSHGYYYFNNQMKDAKGMLHKSDQYDAAVASIAKNLIPSSAPFLDLTDWIQIGWLSALEHFTLIYRDEIQKAGLGIDLAAIRKHIIRQSLTDWHSNRRTDDEINKLRSLLTPSEYWRVFMPANLFHVLRKNAGSLRELVKIIVRKLNLYDWIPVSVWNPQHLPVDGLQTVLDVFDKMPTTFEALDDHLKTDGK